jgi:transcription elongation factor SPT5
MDERSEDLDKLAQGFRERARQAAPMRYSGDMNEVPQRLLMPSVHDANLWQVRVKVRRSRSSREVEAYLI